MMTTVETIADTTTDLQDGVHMSDPHLEVFMTPIWTDALLLAETIMPMVAIHTEAEVLEDLPLGIYFLKTSDFFICKLLICTVGLVSTLRQLCDLQDPTTFDKCFFYFAKLSVTSYMLQDCVVILRPTKFYKASANITSAIALPCCKG